MSDLFFWRQCLILITLSLHVFSGGVVLSLSSVLTPAILSPNSTDIKASPDEASWIDASLGFTGVVGYLIFSPLLDMCGRKITHFSLSSVVAISWILHYLANSVKTLCIAKMIMGLALGGIFIEAIILAEYTDPKRRGYFMTIRHCSFAMGSLLCHSLSLSCTWRQITIFGLIAALSSLITTLFWPESPAYLAKKGKFEDCKKSFYWLNGKSKEREHELKTLISVQVEIQGIVRNKSNVAKRLLKQFVEKDFLKTVFLITVISLALDCCGSYFFMMYTIRIMLEVIGDESAAIYCSIAGDLLTTTAIALSCLVIVYFKRRTLVLSFGMLSVLLMYTVSLLIYIKSVTYFGSYLKFLPPFFILLTVFIVNLGLIPICSALSGEVFPLEYRSLGSCIAGILYTAIYIITMKVMPILMDKTGVEGTYAVYSTCLLVCILILYFKLPETKDRILQDIEDEMKCIKRTTVIQEPMLMTEE